MNFFLNCSSYFSLYLVYLVFFILAKAKAKANIRANIINILSKYSMSFCLISEIIHPRYLILNINTEYWILIVLILNIMLSRVNNFDIKQKRCVVLKKIFVLLYATNTKQDLGQIKANKIQQISVKTQFFFVKAELQHI